MNPLPPDCAQLAEQAEMLLELVRQEKALQDQDLTAAKASLRKAIAPTFEIVFAGAFSAGKSMLINALLERELLYSAEGHATGTECQIAYAAAGQERVVLTFMSVEEVQSQAAALCDRLEISPEPNLEDSANLGKALRTCGEVITSEGGESKSERAKQASALRYLLRGFLDNRSHIAQTGNRTFSMEEVNFSSLQEAASYARRGSNSAVLRRVEYYCHHPLLEDGNVLIDTPGIDAPVQRDAELTYAKVEDGETSAVVCVLKPASSGEMTREETELLEKTRRNPGIRDRVFYIFNRIDETWYNAQLRQRLESLLQSQFFSADRIYQTSGLLGFYGSQVRQTLAQAEPRYGLDSIFADSIRSAGGSEDTPQFVSEFNRYCGNSGKLPRDRFRIELKSYESPNDNYIRILNEQGAPLIEQLIQDSGVEIFREAITRYLTQEKRPQLLMGLAEDLRPHCLSLRSAYEETQHRLASQPNNIDALKEQKLYQLHQDLREAGEALTADLEAVINQIVASNADTNFEADFSALQRSLVTQLDTLVEAFSVGEVHRRAQQSHRRNSVVPLLGILAEAFYYLANGLEEALVASAEAVAVQFFGRLRHRIQAQPYHRQLLRLLGHDGGVEAAIAAVQTQVVQALRNEAQTECDRYVRERPAFFDEETASLFQLQQTLQQACQGYDYLAMVEAEPAIRQLLKLDFEEKVRLTVMRTFRQTINQTINLHLRAAAQALGTGMVQRYEEARSFLGRSLEQEAAAKLAENERQRELLRERMERYEGAVRGINGCLRAMGLAEHGLPLLGGTAQATGSEHDFVDLAEKSVNPLDEIRQRS